jgi:molecular chaperone HscB
MRENTSRNYYELFDLPVSFEVDRARLDEHFRSLQRAFHPDKYASGSEREKRLAVQQAAYINEAFQVLKNPIRRGHYLLELKAIPVNDQQSAMDETFLMEQMELREALEEARHSDDPQGAMMHLMQDIEARFERLTEELTGLFVKDSQDALAQAVNTLGKMQFIDRLREEIEEIEDELITTVVD